MVKRDRRESWRTVRRTPNSGKDEGRKSRFATYVTAGIASAIALGALGLTYEQYQSQQVEKERISEEQAVSLIGTATGLYNVVLANRTPPQMQFGWNEVELSSADKVLIVKEIEPVSRRMSDWIAGHINSIQADNPSAGYREGLRLLKHLQDVTLEQIDDQKRLVIDGSELSEVERRQSILESQDQVNYALRELRLFIDQNSDAIADEMDVTSCEVEENRKACAAPLKLYADDIPKHS